MKLVNYQLQTQIEYLGENKTNNFFKEYLQSILEDTSKPYYQRADYIGLSLNEIKNKTPQKKITITGGEPLEQKEALVKLLNKLDGFDIGLYTSYSIDSIDESILKKLRFIKTGKFEVSKKINHSFYGSSNQNLYFLK